MGSATVYMISNGPLFSMYVLSSDDDIWIISKLSSRRWSGSDCSKSFIFWQSSFSSEMKTSGVEDPKLADKKFKGPEEF